MKKLLPGIAPNELARAASLICLCLRSFDGAELPELAYQRLRKRADEIQTLRKRKRRKGPEIQMPPTLVRFVGSRPKLVRLLKRHARVDSASVSAALDLVPWFAMGDSGGDAEVAWHASRTHHRHRLLCPSDSPCERMGSTLRFQWDQRGGQVSARQAIDKLMLAQSGMKFAGDVRDAILANEVAHMMRNTAKYRSGACSRGAQEQQVDEETKVMALAASSGSFTCLEIEAWLAQLSFVSPPPPP